MTKSCQVSTGSSVTAVSQNTAHLPRGLRFLRKAGISTAGAAGLSLALGAALCHIRMFGDKRIATRKIAARTVRIHAILVSLDIMLFTCRLLDILEIGRTWVHQM